MKNSLAGVIRVLAVVAACSGSLAAHAGAQAGGAIEGLVRTADGRPAANVSVRLVEAGRSVATTAEGRFAFEGIGAGRYLIQADDERYGAAVRRVTLAAGERQSIELTLSPFYHMDQLVVTASPAASTREELYQAAQALSGRALRQRVEPSLGETVAREPGVNASYFGPAASRPVIRGLASDRVRVLENGVGTGDISSSSPDHAVAVEAGAADRIEIVRGAATLLYGSSAIGGVVNVIDDRVPQDLPARPLSGELNLLGSSAATEKQISGELKAASGGFVLRGSGLFRDTEDYGIPGLAEAHADAGAAAEEEGVLANSAIRNSQWSGGASLIGGRGYLGAALSGYDSEYGVPGGAHAEEGGAGEQAHEDIAVDLRQRRVDAAGRLRLGNGTLRFLDARVGYADYRHFEVENGEIGTVFENEYWEGRLEAPHRLGRRINGAFGAQASRRDFAATGEEAFVPPNTTDMLALFLFEELDLRPLALQGGVRWERQRTKNTSEGFDTDFDGVSASLGVNWDLTEPLRVALSLARSVKLPSADELFSNGPHLATRSYEIGSTALGRETATSMDATLHIHSARVEGELTAFVNRFDDFIYQEFAGEEIEGLQVLRYTQADARFVGYEAQLHVELAEVGNGHVELELWSDYTRGTLQSPEQPLPRIPPLRIGTGLHYEGTPFTAFLRGRRVLDQDRVAPNEEATPGYTMLEASVGYRRVLGGLLHEITLTGQNLLNQEARNHISLLKEFAPLPGRDIRLAYRVAF